MSGLKSTLVTAVLAAAVGAAAAWGAMTIQARQDRPADFHHLVHERLDLSPEQDRRLDEIEAAFAERRAPLEAEVRQANAELSAAIAASQGETPEVQAAVDHFHTAMGDLQMATIRHVFEMRAVLTPRQAEEFDRAVVETLRADAD
ncbi:MULTISPECIES: Spy/CpxP family protein refolding chaperone [unclassified Brevundimonas]|jgi:Spy/CpxP family protein refolding chaperone|uniref:Spy/CpxP family protein refolding chaperone n=1 Tax=unclassified Brevundimonas TaxID=2622653 RepID=UPI000C4EAA63|nr:MULTISPECIES: periplasmic heavy metal sensor [unclassified Brevundimonas]MAL89098.1 heavy metal resistance protein [Brevundimonas sp.]HAJ03967.1 heavy metal resistance protein [Brevundimonas sp.]|tara:strand:+ start:4887 stop:5324 length:438 start_codon:yes stop_codon:yes gene_type:complete